MTNSDILIYQTEDGETRIDVWLESNTVWLTQGVMASLYQTTPQNITLHVRNIYKEGELDEDSTSKKYLHVQTEGNREVRRRLKFYNLDMILAVGYRVRSHRGGQFRRWATQRLRDFLVKGFVLDDARLKGEKDFGSDYFEELLERIRDIRTSESHLFRKVTDIFKLAVDYDPRATVSHEFFASVQNKLHFAVHGHTAAELIAERANAEKPNMGLLHYYGSKVRMRDVNIAKNYLSDDELKAMKRIVTMYLDYAEDQAERRRPMYMADWRAKLDSFLKFNEREVLDGSGGVSPDFAKKTAREEYEKYRLRRVADEDRLLQELHDTVIYLQPGSGKMN